MRVKHRLMEEAVLDGETNRNRLPIAALLTSALATGSRIGKVRHRYLSYVFVIEHHVRSGSNTCSDDVDCD